MAAPERDDETDRRIEELSKSCISVDPKDIIEVVESVMASISGDTSTVNQRLYNELESLARFIDTAKSEIAALRPDEIKDQHLAQASDELQLIVNHTEQATHTIFEAVETIEGLAETMPEETSEKITEAVTQVYEACGFQDLTGQRISKVVNALQHIEQKVEGLLEAFGAEFEGLPKAVLAEKSKRADGKPDRPDEDLMNGPQKPGAGQTQAEIDALFD